MVDTSIKNTGNSRSLRTVANALTLYPTYEAMIAAMVNGTFPIDLGPLNAAGLNTRGTDLNKANLLTDATAALLGLTSTSTVDEALAVNHIVTGTYYGTGTFGVNNKNKLTFPMKPSAIIMYTNTNTRRNATGILINPSLMGRAFFWNSTTDNHAIMSEITNVTWGNNYVEWYSVSALSQMNEGEFSYVALLR